MNTIVLTVILLLIVFAVAFYFVHHYYSRRLRREIARAQKSEQLKSVFLANVSRTLRTPLNAILGYSNLILEDNDVNLHPAQMKEMASQINKNTTQLLDFIAQLLELSNFEGNMPTFTKVEVNLAELMASYRREALNITKSEVGVCLRSDLSPHCKAAIDTNSMHQLMMHLLTNAANHTTQGDIIINYSNERGGLKVTIAYQGMGQAELIGADIYSFLQKEDVMTLTKDKSELGLSICKAIIDALDGELDIDTTENGRKTIASFWFPCKMRDQHKGSRL